MKNPHETDLIVGNNIRLRRTARRLSQTELGACIGVTFQQVQKYERGTNRVSASKLLAIANLLQCTVADLFNGADPGGESIEPHRLMSREAIRTARLLDELRPAQRTCIRKLLESMVEAEIEAMGAEAA